MTIHVSKDFGVAGAGLNTTRGSVHHPGLRTIIGGLVADIAAAKGTAPAADGTSAEASTDLAAASAITANTVATADAAVQGGGYVQADVQTIATLANQLKVDFNKARTDIATIITYLATVRTIANSLKANYNLLRTQVLNLRTIQNTAAAAAATVVMD